MWVWMCTAVLRCLLAGCRQVFSIDLNDCFLLTKEQGLNVTNISSYIAKTNRIVHHDVVIKGQLRCVGVPFETCCEQWHLVLHSGCLWCIDWWFKPFL